jgi:hypothetical protein
LIWINGGLFAKLGKFDHENDFGLTPLELIRPETALYQIRERNPYDDRAKEFLQSYRKAQTDMPLRSPDVRCRGMNRPNSNAAFSHSHADAVA